MKFCIYYRHQFAQKFVIYICILSLFSYFSATLHSLKICICYRQRIALNVLHNKPENCSNTCSLFPDVVPNCNRRGLEPSPSRFDAVAAKLHPSSGFKFLADRLRKFCGCNCLLLFLLRHHHVHCPQSSCRYYHGEFQLVLFQ